MFPLKQPLLAKLDELAKRLHKEEKFVDELVILQSHGRLKRLMMRAEKTCRWRDRGQQEHGFTWRTSCGETVEIQYDCAPTDQGVRYCFGCGGKVECVPLK